jgi:hypothetical protein
MFDYKAGWVSINHQDGNGNGATVTYHNTMGLQNWCSFCASITWTCVDAPAWANGSQWMENENAGDPTTTMSTGPGYEYAALDPVAEQRLCGGLRSCGFGTQRLQALQP